MQKITPSHIFCVMFFLIFCSAKSQLVSSKVQIWEKSNNQNERDSIKEESFQLLNFHHSVKSQYPKNNIGFHKDKSYTLVVVHSTKEKEKIWAKGKDEISLHNTRFEKNSINGTVTIKKKPSIFSYRANANKKQKADSVSIALEKQNLYEIIFDPKKFSLVDLRKIHTYLAIKYGISLVNQKYVNSSNKVIWDPEKHKNYKHRPTGIGRDDANELYQKQSWNEEERLLTISSGEVKKTNTDNKSIFNDKEFVIWSDDNGDLEFEDENDLRILKRKWEINFIGDQISTEGYFFQISKNVLNPESKEINYWLLINQPDGSYQKVQGTLKNEYVEFPKLSLDKDHSGSDVFTFATSEIERNDSASSNYANDSSIKDLDGKTVDVNLISLYPNPVRMNEVFTVAFPPMNGLEISIYDGGGRFLSKKAISADAKQYTDQISVQGTYLIMLTLPGKTIKTFKLIVL